MFLTGLVLTGLGYFSLQFVPGVSPDHESSLDCSSPWSILKVMMMMMRPGVFLISQLRSAGASQTGQSWSLIFLQRVQSPAASSVSSLTNLRYVISDKINFNTNHLCQICSSFNLANCSGDSVVEFSIQSDLGRHNDQVNPGCLYLPIDSSW